MAIEKPISQACLRNQGPILEVLKGHMKTPGKVVEIGCGTGQHAVHFARHLAHLYWQATDQARWLNGANSWIEEANLSNLPPAEPCSLNFSTSLKHPSHRSKSQKSHR